MNKTKKFIILFYLLLAPLVLNSSFAQAYYFDYSVENAARSYPFGLIFSGKLGLNHIIWGEKKDQNSFFYGYLRPSFYWQTIGVVNRVGVELDLYPVSFFGFHVGSAYGARFKDSDYFECGKDVNCRGSVSRNYIKSRLALGYGDLFFASTASFEYVKHSNNDLPFAEDIGVLYGAPGKDLLITYSGALGFKLSQKNRLAFIASQNIFIGSGVSQSFGVLMGQREYEDWSVAGGGGPFNLSYAGTEFTFMAIIKWTGVPSLAGF